MSVSLKLKATSGFFKKPVKSHSSDAGFDVFSVEEDQLLLAGSRKLFSVGFSMQIPEGYEVQVRPRSGLSLRHGVTVLNSPGTIDSSYRGEVKVILQNTGDVDCMISRGDRIAQLVVAVVPEVEMVLVDNLDSSERGENGWGSTGV